MAMLPFCTAKRNWSWNRTLWINAYASLHSSKRRHVCDRCGRGLWCSGCHRASAPQAHFDAQSTEAEARTQSVVSSGSQTLYTLADNAGTPLCCVACLCHGGVDSSVVSQLIDSHECCWLPLIAVGSLRVDARALKTLTAPWRTTMKAWEVPVSSWTKQDSSCFRWTT